MKVQVAVPGEQPSVSSGPEYRRSILETIADMRRAGKALPLTEAEARALPLTELVARDAAWAAENRPGYVVELVNL